MLLSKFKLTRLGWRWDRRLPLADAIKLTGCPRWRHSIASPLLRCQSSSSTSWGDVSGLAPRASSLLIHTGSTYFERKVWTISGENRAKLRNFIVSRHVVHYLRIICAFTLSSHKSLSQKMSIATILNVAQLRLQAESHGCPDCGGNVTPCLSPRSCLEEDVTSGTWRR